MPAKAPYVKTAETRELSLKTGHVPSGCKVAACVEPSGLCV